jgi:2-haloacid dehalogenase
MPSTHPHNSPITSAPDAYLFDLGNVLIGWDPRKLYLPLANGDTARVDHFVNNIMGRWNHERDAGQPFEAGIAAKQALHPEFAEWIGFWWLRWPDMLLGPIEGTVEVLRTLKDQGARLYAITNWSAETFPMARARYPFLQWFADIVVSGDEKLAKPDAAIYQVAIQRCNLVPSRTFFIDDTMVNIETAQELGFITHHFSSPERLREAMASVLG